MKTITRSEIDVESLSELAKLSFTDEEKSALESEMKSFFILADKIKNVNVGNKDETYHLENITNVFREDEEAAEFTSEEMLSGAKTKADNYITVPRVVEG